MIVDTHCHLDDTRYNDDMLEVLARAKENGVKRFIIPGADPKTLPRAVELSQEYDEIYFSVGVHPYDAINYNRSLLEKHISNPKCVAVGECGLDYYRLPKKQSEIDTEKDLQKKVFIDQIDLANRYGKPLIVHIRDASRDSQDILERHVVGKGGVLHCYNADNELLKLADLGFYFGIGGVLTFKNAKKLVDIYPLIPQDKLLIETDAPYLTPHPHRGKRNEPAYCSLVAEKMSELSNISKKRLLEMCEKNTYNLFFD